MRNQNFENQNNFTTDVVEVFQSQIKIFSRFFWSLIFEKTDLHQQFVCDYQ